MGVLGRIAAAVALCLMTYGSAGAAPPQVWIALSEAGGAHAEAADALRGELERGGGLRAEIRTVPWQQFSGARPEPKAVVAVGLSALRGMQEMFAAAPSPPPLLAILVPRVAFERLADPARLRTGTLSAVFLDQPPGRQLELIRLALPSARSVGILVGPESRNLAAGLERAARERALHLHVEQAEVDGLFPALQSVLADADLLLALPDPSVFSSQTAAAILSASYRRRVPLVGFSPAYSRAGALLSLYTTPAQAGVQGAELLRQVLAGRPLPAPTWPREFSVSVNADVARSLDLSADERTLAEQLRKKERQ
jgi:hypothetical protein